MFFAADNAHDPGYPRAEPGVTVSEPSPKWVKDLQILRRTAGRWFWIYILPLSIIHEDARFSAK